MALLLPRPPRKTQQLYHGISFLLLCAQHFKIAIPPTDYSLQHPITFERDIRAIVFWNLLGSMQRPVSTVAAIWDARVKHRGHAMCHFKDQLQSGHKKTEKRVASMQVHIKFLYHHSYKSPSLSTISDDPVLLYQFESPTYPLGGLVWYGYTDNEFWGEKKLYTPWLGNSYSFVAVCVWVTVIQAMFATVRAPPVAD